jgi:hypothetical protein
MHPSNEKPPIIIIITSDRPHRGAGADPII